MSISLACLVRAATRNQGQLEPRSRRSRTPCEPVFEAARSAAPLRQCEPKNGRTVLGLAPARMAPSVDRTAVAAASKPSLRLR